MEDSEGWKEYHLKVVSMQKTVDSALAKSAEEEAKLQKEAAKNAEEARKEELSILKWFYDMGEISAAEYYAELEKYRDKYLKEKDDEWRSITLQIKKYQSEIEKDIYQDKKEHSFNWISGRNYYGDWDKYDDTEEEAYNRVFKNISNAYKDGILSAEEFAKEADTLLQHRKEQYYAQQDKSDRYITDRNFYNDWEEIGDTEEDALKRKQARTEEYFE